MRPKILPLVNSDFLFGHSEKNSRGKNSKLKEITENSSSNPKKSALFCKFLEFLRKNNKNKNQNIRKWIKTQEKTQNSR